MQCVNDFSMQGRFSGRLETKADEAKVNLECKLLGPLVGGIGKRGEKSRMTLAKIVRGIASGEVRKFLEDREDRIRVSTSPIIMCMLTLPPDSEVLKNPGVISSEKIKFSSFQE